MVSDRLLGIAEHGRSRQFLELVSPTEARVQPVAEERDANTQGKPDEQSERAGPDVIRAEGHDRERGGLQYLSHPEVLGKDEFVQLLLEQRSLAEE